MLQSVVIERWWCAFRRYASIAQLQEAVGRVAHVRSEVGVWRFVLKLTPR